MIHSFIVELAVKFGEKQAIVLDRLAYWQKKNQLNDKNFFDGHYWTCNSIKSFQEIFPYWSLKQIRSILDKIEELNLIKTGNYNFSPWDRTKWYTIIDSAILKSYEQIWNDYGVVR